MRMFAEPLTDPPLPDDTGRGLDVQCPWNTWSSLSWRPFWPRPSLLKPVGAGFSVTTDRVLTDSEGEIGNYNCVASVMTQEVTP